MVCFSDTIPRGVFDHIIDRAGTIIYWRGMQGMRRPSGGGELGAKAYKYLG